MSGIRPETHRLLSEIMIQNTGVQLGGSGKEYLIDARLAPLVRQRNYKDVESLVQHALSNRDKALLSDVIDALTTNETSFFRDQKPFNSLAEFSLPHFHKSKKTEKHLRIWSAACSSGQEALSIAMTIDKLGIFSDWRIEIVGTDVSNQMLDRARTGKYNQFEVQRGLSAKDLITYFEQDGQDWKVKSFLSKMIRYEYANILKPGFLSKQYDIIFCRNLLIYFDQSTKRIALDTIHKSLSPSGHLVIGGAESLIGMQPMFEPIPGHYGFYKKC